MGGQAQVGFDFFYKLLLSSLLLNKLSFASIAREAKTLNLTIAFNP
jgi:hypothetical protein